MENERDDGYPHISVNPDQIGHPVHHQEASQVELQNEPQREKMHREKSGRKGKKFKGVAFGAVAVLCMAVIFVGVLMYKKYSPSKKIMPLEEYFGQQPENSVILVLHDKVLEEKGMYLDDQVYIPYEVVTKHLNKRFYFDSSENILNYTTATEVIRSEVGSTAYYVNKSKTDEGYAIVKTEGEQVYVALPFIEEFSNVESSFYKKPYRLMLESGWGNTYEYYSVRKGTKLRNGAGIKCDVLASLKEKEVVRVVQDGSEELESYAKVMTKDGVTGFVLKKHLSDKYEEKLTNEYKEETYPHILKDKTICMAWHQVTSQQANNNLLNTLSSTKGINVISPTWFSISTNKGDVKSIASETYVQRAHSNGLEVWALCDDFAASEDKVDLSILLGNTTNRDKLVNRLIANAIQYDLDGLNIDFEYIKEDTAPAYLEFLRELSVKCRNNGIVLSVDSYVPTEYTAYYDREEQGKIADYVVVMGYDEHYSGSKESGSVASIGFVKEAVDNITQMVDPSQVIMGIPFYTRLWKEQPTEDGVKVTSNAYGMEQSENVLRNNNATAKWDDKTAQNYAEFEYNGCTYKMWMEDKESMEAKLDVIFADRKEGKIAGISGWKLGLEKSSIWNTIIKYTN